MPVPSSWARASNQTFTLYLIGRDLIGRDCGPISDWPKSSQPCSKHSFLMILACSESEGNLPPRYPSVPPVPR
eukprot:1361441-Pyramimonas_sp.AAC.1